MNFLTILVSLLALLIFIHVFIQSARKKKRFPPLAGSVFHMSLNYNTLHDYLTHLAAKHKTFRIFQPDRRYIFTVEPAVVEYLLKTNFTNYGKGSYNYDNLKDLLGDGIFVVDGEKWRHQRKLASYEFSTKNLRNFSSTVFKHNAAKLAMIVSENADSKMCFDAQDLFMKFTMDSTFSVLFGVELDTLSGLNEEGRAFVKSLDMASDLSYRRYVDVLWKLKRFFNIGTEATLKKCIKTVDDYVYKLIYSKQTSFSKQHNHQKDDILSRFLIERDKDSTEMTDKYLRDIVINIIIAGRDTTAVTLTWFFYMLCKHPYLQERIALEVKEVTNADSRISVNDFTSVLTEEVLDKMQYLQAAIAETLRLYPAIPLDPKMCFSDDKLPNGFDISKGDLLAYAPYGMGRMKFLWGDDAEVYRPERWLIDGVFRPENPFQFTAFQAGPRICLGKDFAYCQMKIISAVLIHFFTFKLNDEKRDVKYTTSIALRIDQGLEILALRRGV